MTRPNKQSGFTLVEVLVALLVFSFLSAATLSATAAAVRSKAQMETKALQLSQIAKTRILLKSDFANTLLLPRKDKFGQDIPIWFAGGERGNDAVLTLSRTGFENPGGLERRSNLQNVEYVLDGDVLIRKTVPRFDAPERKDAIEQTLLGGIESIQMRFLGSQTAEESEPQWTEYWLSGPPPAGTPHLPMLAEVQILFKNGRQLDQVFFVGADQ